MLLAVLPFVLATGWLGLAMVEEQARSRMGQELQAALDADAMTLQNWLKERCLDAEVWANDSGVSEAVCRLLDSIPEAERTPERLLRAPELAQLRDRLDPVCARYHYPCFLILDRRQTQLAAHFDSLVGGRTVSASTDVATRALAGETAFSHPMLSPVEFPDDQETWRKQLRVMFVASPIRNVRGEIAAALVFRLHPRREFSRLLETRRFGVTGETFAFNRQGVLLSDSRFNHELRRLGLIPDAPDSCAMLTLENRDPGGNLTEGYVPTMPRAKQPLTRLAAAAIDGDHGVITDGYRDYRGIHVVGAWRWFPEHQFGIARKIDLAEAYGPFREVRLVFGALFSLLCMTVGVCWVIQRRQALTESKAVGAVLQNQAVLDAAHEVSIIATDPQGVITVFNRGAEKMLGYAAEEMIGRQTPLLIHLESEVAARGAELTAELGRRIEGFDVFVENSRRQGAEEREWTYVRKDGSHLTVSLVVTVVRDQYGRLVGFLGVAVDVTQRKQAEDELRKYASDMEQASARIELQARELAVRADELAAANHQAAKATELKDAFLANMSHEIRTPMTAILGYTDILLEEAGSERPRCRESLLTIKQNGEHLLSLINDILDLSKIEAGRIEIERVRWSPLKILSEVRSLMQFKAKEKGLSFDFDFDGPIPESILTDPTRVRQVLINLVGNALKFTETGGIRVVTRLIETGGRSQLQFEVIDSGIGMSPEQQSRLFRPFTQADSSTTRKFGGTGLGLSISKNLAEALGGSLTVESESGRGTTFRLAIEPGGLSDVRMTFPGSNELELPRETNGHRLLPTKAAAHSLSGRRVLIAEDGRDIQTLLSHLLKKAGAEVELVENGELAVEAVRAAANTGRPWDAVLMDMQMPLMDGVDATRAIRVLEKSQGTRVPIIALTSNAMQSDRERCLQAGMDAFMSKPIDAAELIATVARFANQAAAAGIPPHPADEAAGHFQPTASSRLTEKLATDLDFLAELIDIYADTAPGLAAELQQAVESDRGDDVRRIGHKLRGSTGIFGQTAILRKLDQLECGAKSNPPAFDRDLARQVAEDVAELIRSVREDLRAQLASNAV